MSETHIRKAEQRDASTIARLLIELGYPSTTEFVSQQLVTYTEDPNALILVAEQDAEVLGVLGFQCIPFFHEVGMIGRITFLVIDSRTRRSGIGEQLVSAAEAFAKAQHCNRIEVTSSEHRTGAHNFYKKLGYETKPERFIKQIVA